MSWMTTSPESLFLVIASTIGVYVALIALTRLAGLRSFSKMSGFDFAITVAIGSVIAGTVMAKTPPLAQGVGALVALFAAQMALATLRSTYSGLTQFIDNSPRLVMVREHILADQLKAAKMTESDLWAKLREANILRLDQVEVVIAESTGDVSVLHHDGGRANLSPELLRGVIAGERYHELAGHAFGQPGHVPE